MLVLRAVNRAQHMAYCTPAHSPAPHFSSAQHHQTLLQRCCRSAGLQLYHSHVLGSSCTLTLAIHSQRKARNEGQHYCTPLTVYSQKNINHTALESSSTRKQHSVLFAGLKGADNGVGCFPLFLLRQQSKKAQGREAKNEQVQHSREPRKGDARVVENLWAREKGRTWDMFYREGTK